MRPMQKEDIAHLARLARIKVTDEEIPALVKDMEAILDYVKVVDDIAAEDIKKAGVVRNVFREDEVTCEPGSYTEALLAEMPDRDGQYLKVKKILNND